MANSKKKSSSAGKIAGTAGVVLSAVELIPRIVDVVQPVVDPLIHKDQENYILVPDLYKKDFLLTLQQATELLSNYGLKALPSKLQVGDANPKYRKCFDQQVIGSTPKQGQKVLPGSTVILKYITQDVIDASQLIFDEAEKRKAETKQIKIEKRTARFEQAKTVTVDTAKKAKDVILKVLPHSKKSSPIPEAEKINDKPSEFET